MKKNLFGVSRSKFLFVMLLLLPFINYARQNMVLDIDAGEFDSNLTDFISKSNGVISSVDANTINISNTNGDHFALYNGTQNFFKSFKLEADIELINGRSAALIFGIQDLNNPGSRWLGANFNKDETDKAVRVFDVGSGRGDLVMSSKPDFLNFDEKMHLSLDVLSNGDFTYSIENIGGTTHQLHGHISNWAGGYFGLLTFRSEANFSNVRLTDRTNYSGTNIDNSAGTLITNLNDLYYHSGTWTVNENGLKGNAEGDEFLFSTTSVKDFVYSADVTFDNRKNSAASLMARSTNDLVSKNMYIANVNAESGEARLFKFQNNSALDLVSSKRVPLTDDNTYHLELTAVGKHMVFKVNDMLIANTADYTYGDVYGQNDAILEGYLGLLSWNADVTYQNVNVTELTETTNPQLKLLNVSAVGGEVEHDVLYKPDQYVYIAYVDHQTSQINLNFETVNASTATTVTNSNQQVVGNTGLPVDIGLNTYTITTNEGDATLLYRVVVIRRADPEIYYNEQYRDQYHMSVKEGWSNDPNGMVYYNGEYHLFYQFYTDINWGPMHWAHSVSTDLIHWEELPITFYPDEYGTMFSGSAVVDETNTSGLFVESDGSPSVSGGLVSIITCHGNGERVIIAYSKDGRDWEKVEGVVKDWTEDPLNNADFRDPKVFRYNNKWFMVIAGGPLRIYSSDNLIEWNIESTYDGLHTECPDLYRLPVVLNDQIQEYKWVLSRSGRFYKVGDFAQVNGKYQFIIDDEYSGWGIENDGIQNFGLDSYAAMTYSLGNFDEYQRVIQTNWMRPYKSNISELRENLTFNGDFNLQLELSLVKDQNGKYVLQQKPIQEYETLRDQEKTVTITNSVIDNESINLDYEGESYEIVAEFTPDSDVSDVGFKVRVGSEYYTKVGYNIIEDRFYIDRSQSGYGNNDFFQTFSQKSVLTPEGNVELHIYVDRSSVEMFMNHNTIVGSAQIFPPAGCDKLEVYALGGQVMANIDILPLNSIWINKVPVTKPTEVLIPSNIVNKYLGDEFTIEAAIYPKEVSQAVTWEMAGNDILTMVVDDNTATFTANKTGEVKVKVYANDDESVFEEITISIRENNFVTNLDWTKFNDEWYFDNTQFVGQSTVNTFAYADNRVISDHYKYCADVDYNSGIVNLIFGSKTTNAYDGCYAIQLIEGSNQVRFFDFKNDYTFCSMASQAFVSGTNHIEIEVIGSVVTVTLNGVIAINKDVQSTGRIYSNGLFALGICNGTAKFANVIYTDEIETPDKNLTLPSDPKIQYMGRIDFTNPDMPIFAFPNVTIKTKFEGTSLDFLVRHSNGSKFDNNYFMAIIDGKDPVKFMVSYDQQEYTVAKDLTDGVHTAEIIKITESYNGVCQFLGFKTDAQKSLLTPGDQPELKLEFLGNSITCGYGIEGGAQPASDNSYYTYAAVAARELNAQFNTVSYSGIGVVLGFPSFLMDEIYDRSIAIEGNTPDWKWDFTKYVPQYIVVALGTNDFGLGFGAGDISTETFNTGYSNLIADVRTANPDAVIICTNSPMISDPKLGNSINQVVNEFNTAGDNKVYYFGFSFMQGGGAGGHPGIADGQKNGEELASFIRSLVSTSVDDINDTNDSISIFPNPARDIIHIQSTIKVNAIEVYDISSKLIKTIKVSLPGESNIDISQLEKGIYLFSFVNETESQIVKKVIVL
nr:GH32 C-terminal domain-containing protein [uncultured Carboxylicivirga sp.]